MESKMTCVHCLTSPVSRPRGLCWRCYYRPGVKENYPTRILRRWQPKLIVGSHEHASPGEPTGALPGSEAKILVMIDRAERGESIFHPLDAEMPQ